MERATQALLRGADLLLAERRWITDHNNIMVQRARKTEEQAMTVLALQAPVAGGTSAQWSVH